MRKTGWMVLAAVMLLFFAAGNVSAQGGTPKQPDPTKYQWVKVVDGFDRPVAVIPVNDGSGRLFVLEQPGTVIIVKNGQMNSDPFLDISDLVTPDVAGAGYSERGLLGLAFHPDYSKNGVFFIDYTDHDGNTVIARYNVNSKDPDHADPASAVKVLSVKQPFDNHKGGQLAFGKDGYLYIGLGDGGNLGDPQGNGQRLDTMLGKILRIDVSVDSKDKPYTIPPTNPFLQKPGALPEIWSYGFRNPWRFSFDRETHDLYVGDVGEAKWEEVDFQPAASKGGENYGWSIYEGNERFSQKESAGPLVKPIAVFGHNIGCAIIGGYVYRGKAMPELRGIYIFGDYCYGRIWTTIHNADDTWQTNIFMETGKQISSFGEDDQGELYFSDYKGALYKFQAK